jgi:[ribosomal protein S5]-alanine N-acetyltransferase
MSQTLNFPSTVPDLIEGSLHLRELTEDDIPSWFERATDAESAWLAGDPIPESIEMGAQWLERHRERFRQQKGIRWAIRTEGTAQSIGTIGLTITSKEERVAELGYVIARAYWSKGIATGAARMVVRYAFDTLQLAEIRADPLASNTASRRVLEKIGFRFHGLIPDYDQTDDGPVEGALYVLRNSARL